MKRALCDCDRGLGAPTVQSMSFGHPASEGSALIAAPRVAVADTPAADRAEA
jgi:hypothetical protein